MQRFVLCCCFVLVGWLLLAARTGEALLAAPLAQNGWNIGLRGRLGSAVSLVSAHGSTLLAVMGDRVVFFDGSDPTQPRPLRELPILSVTDAVLTGELAYLLTPDGLEVLDVTDPLAPLSLSFCADCGGAELVIAATRAYVLSDVHLIAGAMPVGRLRILDLTDPRHPLLIRMTEELHGVTTLTGDEQRAYVAYFISCDCKEDPNLYGAYVISANDPLADSKIEQRVNANLLQNGYLYGVTDEGLTIASLVDPLTPNVVGTLAVQGVNRMALIDSFVYLLTTDRLLIADVSNPQMPTWIGQVAHATGSPPVLAVAGGRAYVGSQEGLTVFDVSDPNHPVLTSHSGSAFTPLDVGVKQNIVYVLDSITGMQVYDMADPANPAYVKSVNTYPHPYQILLRDARAYVTSTALEEGDDSIAIFDLSDPSAPVKLGTYSAFDFRLEDVASSADAHLYAFGVDTTYGKSLRILDVTTPSAITAVGQYTMTTFDSQRIVLADEQIYAVETGGGLFTRLSRLDQSHLPLMRIAQSWTLPFTAYDLVVAGEFAYVGGANCADYPCYGQFGIYDLSQPEAVSQVGVLTQTSSIDSVVLSGTLALYADGNLHLLDVTQPATPNQIGFFDCDGSAQTLTLVGHYVYLSNCSDRLRVIDVINPAHPVEAGAYSLIDAYGSTVVADSYAYQIDGNGVLHVLDVTDPAAIQEVSTFSGNPLQSRFHTVAGVVGHYLILNSTWEIIVVDISDPAALDEVSRYASAHPGLAIQGNRIVTNDINLFELSDTGELTVLSGYRSTYLEFIDDVAVDDRYAYLVSGGGIWLLDIASPTTPVALGYLALQNQVLTLAAATGGETAQARYLYVTTSGEQAAIQLQMVNVSDLTQPAKTIYAEGLKSAEQGSTWRVRLLIRGKQLFYLSERGRIALFDLSDPANPTLQGEYRLPSADLYAFALDAVEDRMYAVSRGFLYMLQYLPHHQFAPLVVR